MNPQLHHDNQILQEILQLVQQQGMDYLDDLQNRATSTAKVVEKVDTLQEEGLGTIAALQQFNQRFEPVMVGSSGPRYWGFVTGGTTPAAIAGDWLATIYDQNTQSAKGAGDVSGLIELETIQLLSSLFNLPKDFFGGFVTGATLSNFTCLAVARQWFGKQKDKDFAKDGISEKIHVLSATPHSSSLKSLAMLGIGSANVITVEVAEGNREALNIVDLKKKIAELNGEPFILISSAGTVNTVDFDDFEAINTLRSEYNFWWHIDAAFGGFAACSPQYSHLVKGWENADSITVDCHKWLNVPYESAVFFIKEQHQLLQMESFQNANAAYLGNPLDNFSYLNFLPENSRRLKALPAWFTLMSYGKKGYQQLIQDCVAVTLSFADFIEQHPGFKLLAPVWLNTVCFTLQNEELVAPFLQKLNATGKVFMTPTQYKGKKGIRAAFVNWRTTTEDVELVTAEMIKVLELL
ncbi:pyridoxal phosphate-dependent decarboxylase family protein [Pedobacter rhizosphaerae]|uniref:Glutamate or tyrosine decarboxylase n=1 Tax=Pedobacter rhizosphaerae TaxID=390241 RepID=A0A1H9LHU9_9SPHI|nr:pyridoxal-dependent decarboxylase [Pedobacter rhizosphaerae]SER10695.1 Glutamate or tyrosine decarboxylase [Pedobacter rhizosphaerae]